MEHKVINDVDAHLSKLMENSFGMTDELFKVTVPPLEYKVIDEVLLRKYLSTEAAEIVFNPVYNTVVEHMEIDWIKSMIGEIQYNKKGYFTQYLQVLGDGELTEEKVMKFCYLINHLVQQGVFMIGTLCQPAKFDFADGNWAIVFYAVAPKFELRELREKYGNVFCSDGERPLMHIDNLGDKEWEKWKREWDQRVETNFPNPDVPQVVKEVMTSWLDKKDEENKNKEI